MSGQCCFICASDEGVFLDITKENGEKLCRQLKTCLSVKVAEDVALTRKICHKCGFELEQCETFIQKYNKSTKTHKRAKKTRCAVCSESLRTRYAFDVHKGQSLNNPLQKIQDLFKENQSISFVEGDLICLSCRYSIDILHDIKKIYVKNSAQLENNTHSNLHKPTVTKIDTIAVSRKTTITKAESIKLSLLDSGDTDSDTMARGQSRVSKVKNKKASAKSKLRVCDECHNTVENGNDMYRFYRTGLTVCKTCWINMDPSQHSPRKRARTEHGSGGGGSVETKLCAVFLKDVLKDSTSKDEKIYRTEKDLQGNTVYIITDESSESDAKSRKSSPEPKEPKEDSKTVKPSDVKKAENADKVNKRGTKRSTRNKKNESTDGEQISTAVEKSNGNSSEASQEPITTTKVGRRKRKDRENTVQVTDKQVSEPEGRRTRKKLRTLMEETTTERGSSISSESSLPEGSGGRAKRKKRTDNIPSEKPTVAEPEAANIVTSEITPVLDAVDEASRPTTATTALNARKSDDKVDRKSYSADETTQEFKSPVRKERRRASLSIVGSKPLSFETENVSPAKEKKSEEHACDECGVTHENKLASMTHLLTHFKQPELKLSKVTSSTSPDDNESTGQAMESEVDNLSEAEKQSEEVRLTVDDEEDVPEKNTTEDDLTERDNDASSKDVTEKDIAEKDGVDENAADDTPDKESVKIDTKESITAVEAVPEKDVSGKESTASDEKEKDVTEKDTVEKEKSDASITDKSILPETTENDESQSITETNQETVKVAETTAEKETIPNDTDVQELDDENEDDMILKTTPDETGKETMETEDTIDNKVSENNENEEVKLTDAVTDDEPKQTSSVCTTKYTEDHKVHEGDADSKLERNSIGVGNLRRNSTDSHKSTKDDDAKDNAEEETDIEQLKVSDTEANENVTELEDTPVVSQNNIKENKQPGEGNKDASDSPRKKKIGSPKTLRKDKKRSDVIEENDVESETDIKIVDAESPEITVEQDVIPENIIVLDDKAKDNNVVEVDLADEHSKSPSVTIVEEKNGEIQSGADKENDKDLAVIAINEVSRSQSCSPRKKPQEDSTTAATEVLQEVFQLATNESQKDQETIDVDAPKHESHKETTSNDIASRETRTSADMPSLDAISADVENDDVLLE